MCVFHVSSETDSFENFLLNTTLPVYQTHKHGDERSNGKRSPYNDYGFSCDVSKKEWNDFPGQVEDAISFLKSHSYELKRLATNHVVSDMRLDFPVESRLVANELFSQCDYLPPELIKLAGEVGIGIEISQYWPAEAGEGSEQSH